MKRNKSFQIYFRTLAVCLAVFCATACVILDLSDNSTESSAIDTYTPPSDPSICFLINILQGNTPMGVAAMWIDCEENTLYTTFLSHPHDIPTPDRHLYATVNIGDFCALVDNCNGTLYTDNSGIGRLLMGRDVKRLIENSEYPTISKVMASFLQDALSPDSIDLFEKEFGKLVAGGTGNISAIHVAMYRDEIENCLSCNTIKAAYTQEFINLLTRSE